MAFSPLLPLLALGMGLLLSAPVAAQAEKWSAQWSAYASATRTQLVDIGLNPGFARQLQPIRQGGYEAAQWEWIGFQRWYAPAWRDTRATWLTPLNPSFGVLWGLSTGERAPKYRVAPGLHLGAVYQSEIARVVSLSLKALHV